MKAYVKSITSIDTKDLNLPIGSYIGEVVKIINERYLIKLDKKFKVVAGTQIAVKLHATWKYQMVQNFGLFQKEIFALTIFY